MECGEIFWKLTHCLAVRPSLLSPTPPPQTMMGFYNHEIPHLWVSDIPISSSLIILFFFPPRLLPIAIPTAFPNTDDRKKLHRSLTEDGP